MKYRTWRVTTKGVARVLEEETGLVVDLAALTSFFDAWGEPVNDMYIGGDRLRHRGT